MPPSKGAEKKTLFRTLSVLLLSAVLCALPLSCAHRAPGPTAALRIDSGPAALSATAPPTPERSTAPVTASPAGTPAVTATPAPTPFPSVTASPSPTPVPTASPTPKPTPKPTVKSVAKTAAKTAPKKTRTPTAKPKPTATPAPASGGVKAQENKMISLVNEERKKEGLAALKYDGSLRAGALKHSNDMSQNDFFSHTSPTYGSFTKRLSAAKISYTSAGENIAMYGSVEKAHTALMNSSGHRANILGEKFTRIGIGVVYNKGKGVYYITQWFAK